MIMEDLKLKKYFQSDIVKSVAIKFQPGFLEPAKLSHERISLSGLIHFLLQTVLWRGKVVTQSGKH